MIYEYRVYEAGEGKLENIQSRFRDHTVKLLEKHGAKTIGYWTPEIGDYNDRLIYILAFESSQQRQKAWDDFRSDPEWHRVRDESEANGPIVARVMNTILKPTDYSPLQ